VLCRQLLTPEPCSETAPSSERLLTGIKVLELATVVAAPSACAMLADMGATVIKVEHPQIPDYVRSWRKRDDGSKTADPAQYDRGVGSGFSQFNRGKKAIAIDYSQPEGLQVLKRLLTDTDVFVTNVRLKALEKVGLDYPTLNKEFPRIVYGHLSAWGLSGPRRDDPGYDVGAFYAYSGLMELCRSSDKAPLPRYPAAFGDSLTGQMLVAGIALALLHRHKTNQGQLVDVSLLRAGVWSMAHPIVAHAAGNTFAAGKDPVIRRPTERGDRVTYITDGSFVCKDGRWIMLLGIESKKHWTKTVQALGLSSELPTDWKVALKTLNFKAATGLVDRVMATKTYHEWHQLFEAADVWHTPINRYEHLMEDEHANATHSFTAVQGLTHKLVKSPIVLSSQAGIDHPTGGAPCYGEHTTEVLGAVGYTPAEIERLQQKKILK